MVEATAKLRRHFEMLQLTKDVCSLSVTLFYQRLNNFCAFKILKTELEG